jgi:hypothetical protein
VSDAGERSASGGAGDDRGCPGEVDEREPECAVEARRLGPSDAIDIAGAQNAERDRAGDDAATKSHRLASNNGKTANPYAAASPARNGRSLPRVRDVADDRDSTASQPAATSQPSRL